MLLDYGNASREAKERPAFIPYHTALEQALNDPVVGNNPLVVSSETVWRRGTDLPLPAVLEESLLLTSEGRSIMRDGKIAVVLQD